jgi:transcriptional regulator with XRE-family HTH domain
MINRAVKLIRQFHKKKQVELADELGISKSYLSEIEAGKKPISLDILNKYSEIFDLPVSSLLFFSESIDRKNKIPEKFKGMFATKVIDIMEWFVNKDGQEETQIQS